MAKKAVAKPARGDSRHLILQRAIEVVEKDGEKAIRVNKIAEECGVQITSLYHYFGNREGLLEAVQVARFSDLSYRDLAWFETAIGQCKSVKDFRRLLAEGIVTMSNSPERAQLRVRRLEILGSAAYRPNLAKHLAEQQILDSRHMADVFEAARARGWIKPSVDLVAYSAFFMGVMNGRVLIELGGDDFDGKAWNAFASDALTSIIP